MRKASAGFVLAVRQVFKRFSEDKGPVLAAALTFFTLLSLVPLLMVALATLGFVLLMSDPEPARAAQAAIQSLLKVVEQVLPGGAAVRAFEQIAQQANLVESLETIMKNSGFTAVVGIASLFWATLQIFVNASVGMNAAFNVDETRSWLRLRLTALALLGGCSVLFFLSLVPTSGPDFVRNLRIPWLGLPDPTPFWIDFLFGLLAVAINISLFALIYRMLPNARVPWKSAMVGGLVTGILWELAKKGFALYLANFGSYDKTYGALGGLILLVTWLYYTNILLLLGAQVAAWHALRQQAAELPVPHGPEEALQAVYEGRAVPLTAGPHSLRLVSSEEAREHTRENIETIRENLQAMSGTVKHTLWNIKTSPERNRASEPPTTDRRKPENGSSA